MSNTESVTPPGQIRCKGCGCTVAPRADGTCGVCKTAFAPGDIQAVHISLEHSWSGCQCTKCGKTRDMDHDWSSNCAVCSKCGLVRKNAHVPNGCVCSKCGIALHNWNPTQNKCGRCGATSPSLLPKIVVAGSAAGDLQNLMAYVFEQPDIFDLCDGDILAEWWDRMDTTLNVRMNPPPSSTEEVLKLAMKRWPGELADLKSLDCRVAIDHRLNTCIGVIKRFRHISEAGDSRYPIGYFPRTFRLEFDVPEGRPKAVEEFLTSHRYRVFNTGYPYTETCYTVGVDSHADLEKLLLSLKSLKTRTQIPGGDSYDESICPMRLVGIPQPVSPFQCSHGLFIDGKWHHMKPDFPCEQCRAENAVQAQVALDSIRR